MAKKVKYIDKKAKGEETTEGRKDDTERPAKGEEKSIGRKDDDELPADKGAARRAKLYDRKKD